MVKELSSDSQRWHHSNQSVNLKGGKDLFISGKMQEEKPGVSLGILKPDSSNVDMVLPFVLRDSYDIPLRFEIFIPKPDNAVISDQKRIEHPIQVNSIFIGLTSVYGRDLRDKIASSRKFKLWHLVRNPLDWSPAEDDVSYFKKHSRRTAKRQFERPPLLTLNSIEKEILTINLTPVDHRKMIFLYAKSLSGQINNRSFDEIKINTQMINFAQNELAKTKRKYAISNDDLQKVVDLTSVVEEICSEVLLEENGYLFPE